MCIYLIMSNNRFKNMKKKWTELKGELENSTITIGDICMHLSATDRTR